MKRCEDCEDCIYIGEGDFICMKDDPKLVLTEFTTPEEDYGWCNNE